MSLPDCFRPFPHCRTEPRLLSFVQPIQIQTTLKALTGVAPSAVMTFASDLYGGSASDKAITADCGILQHLQPGDIVMTDKGFTIQCVLLEGVLLNILFFLVND